MKHHKLASFLAEIIIPQQRQHMQEAFLGPEGGYSAVKVPPRWWEVDDWTNIIAITAGQGYMIELPSDGTLAE